MTMNMVRFYKADTFALWIYLFGVITNFKFEKTEVTTSAISSKF